ncbi:MAG: hypothetical protein ACJ763_02305 [Bdellovibrionia bacterium]
MSQIENNKQKWIKGAVIALPLLLIAGGWMGWRAKHPTLSQSPQSLSKSTAPSNEGAPSTSSNNSVAKNSVDGKTTGGSVAQGSSTSSTHGSEATSVNGSQIQSGSQSPVALNGATTGDSKSAATPMTMTDGCFTLTFNHKAMATHGSDDECSHHRNLIKLPRTDVHASSVCIRVNGTPVRHEALTGKVGEFVIGAVAGPKDIVTARFCVGKAKCSEGCPYPKQEAAKKDEFLEAISGGSNEDTGLAQWEASDAQKNGEVNQALDGDLKKAVEEQELASQRTAAGNSKLEIFKDWVGGEMAMACAGRAGNEPSRSTASVQVAHSGGANKGSKSQ